MGGSASVAKSQAPGKVTGSAAKYEDKSATGDNGSKDVEVRIEPKPLKVEDAQTIASDAEPKSGPVSVTSNVASAKSTAEETTSGPRIVSKREVHEIIPNGFIAEESESNGPAGDPLLQNDYSSSQIALFTVGDFVKVKVEDGSFLEGILTEVVSADIVAVSFGQEDVVKHFLAADCELVVRSDEMEVGDQVQVQPQGSALYFVGRVSQIHKDGTYDVVMEGDDPDDIETHVPESNIRKLMSRRALAVARWKRAALVVSSINNFQSFSLDPGMFSASTRNTKASQKLPGLLEISQASSQQSVQNFPVAP
jgi:hypothetical protein